MSIDIASHWCKMSPDIAIGCNVTTYKYPTDWFFENLDTPMFSQADALAVGESVLKKDTFQNWTNRKLVKSKIVRGKRLLSPLGLAELIFAQVFIRDLGLTPSGATLMVSSCLLLLQREQGKHPVKSVDSLLAFSDPINIPRVVYRGPTLDAVFDSPKPHIIIPFGKMLDSFSSAALNRMEASV